MKSEKRDSVHFKSAFTVLVIIFTMFFSLFTIIVKGTERTSGKSAGSNHISSELVSK